MIPKKHDDFVKNAVDILKADPRVVGVTLGGSYITDEMDEYSDVDLVIAIEPTSHEAVMDERMEIAEKLGTLLAAFTGEHVGEPRLIICLYGPELLHVDLKFISIDDIAHRVEDPHILWQKGSCISEAFKTETATFPTPDLQWIEDRFWIWVHYGAVKIGRGEIFETIDFISYLRQVLIGPLIHMKEGNQPRGVRKIELNAPSYFAQLKETIPSYSKESCLKSTKAVAQLYLELREHFATTDFIKREEAQKYSIEYLDYIASQI